MSDTADTFPAAHDDLYPVVGTPDFHAYWSGRFRAAVRHLLDHPDRDAAERLARETLDAYAARTGQGVQ